MEHKYLTTYHLCKLCLSAIMDDLKTGNRFYVHNFQNLERTVKPYKIEGCVCECLCYEDCECEQCKDAGCDEDCGCECTCTEKCQCFFGEMHRVRCPHSTSTDHALNDLNGRMLGGNYCIIKNDIRRRLLHWSPTVHFYAE